MHRSNSPRTPTVPHQSVPPLLSSKGISYSCGHLAVFTPVTSIRIAAAPRSPSEGQNVSSVSCRLKRTDLPETSSPSQPRADVAKHAALIATAADVSINKELGQHKTRKTNKNGKRRTEAPEIETPKAQNQRTRNGGTKKKGGGGGLRREGRRLTRVRGDRLGETHR